MKILMSAMAILIAGSANAGTFNCETLASRVPVVGKAQVKLSFDLENSSEIYTLSNVQGMISLADETFPFNKISTIKNNPSYHPKKYKGAIQFQNVDADNSDKYGEGLYGSLVISTIQDKFGYLEAHYIFQGDQDGGTIDLRCSDVVH